MDYLDPVKKRKKRNALMLMYVLIGIAISISTITLVYIINGYSIDRDTGQVIQNGLVYIDSKPESAEVYLNGEKKKGRTDLRLVVPEGFYDVKLSRDGYREWNREFVLEGGTLRRLTYARLIPQTIDSEIAVKLPAKPTMLSQSSDKRWLVLGLEDNPLVIRLVDLSREKLELTNIGLPLDLIDTKEPGVWKVIDWADDNKTFLAKFTTATSNEYVLINREDATKSKKLKTLFPGVAYSSVSLYERKNDIVHLFDSVSGKLYKADTNNLSIETLVSDTIDYKTYGSDSILYIVKNSTDEGLVDAMLKKGGEIYKLRTLKKSDNYLLDISKLGDAIIVGVGSAAENRVIVYNDPIGALKQNDFSDIPVPTTVLKIDAPEELSISSDSSCILLRSGQKVAVHEFEADRSYVFQLDNLPDSGTESTWLDGEHLMYVSQDKQYLIDFDGSNEYELIATSGKLNSVADKDINYLYSIGNDAVDPNLWQINRNFMRAKADQ